MLSLLNAKYNRLQKKFNDKISGCKRKMLSWPYENLKEMEFNSDLKYIFM